MMRYIVLSIIICFGLFSAHGSECSGIVAAADSAYAADDFGQAVAGYESAISIGETSSELYYNLGNAYYRDGRLGKSIVAYERALRLNPANDDARANLQFLRTKIIDKQNVGGNVVSLFFATIQNSTTSNAWAWIGLAIFTVFIILVGIYFFTSTVVVRKIGFFGAIVTFLLSVTAMAFSYSSAKKSLLKNEAIVTSPSIILSTAPRTPKDRNEEVALLHEGSKMEIVDSLVSKTDSVEVKWFKVKLPTQHQGWTAASGIEMI